MADELEKDDPSWIRYEKDRETKHSHVVLLESNAQRLVAGRDVFSGRPHVFQNPRAGPQVVIVATSRR